MCPRQAQNRKAAAWVLTRLGLRPSDIRGIDDSSVEGHIRLQRVAYLLQSLGAPLNYEFPIYIYGPYSPDLASDCTSMDDDEAAELASNAEEEMKRFSAVVDVLRESDLESLELTAIFAYARNEAAGKEVGEGLIRAPEEKVKEAKRLLDELQRTI